MVDPQQLREKIKATLRGTLLSASEMKLNHYADALLPLVLEELADRDTRLAELLRLNQEAEAMLRKGIETRTAELAEAWDEGFDNGYDQVLVENSIKPGAGDLRVNPYRGEQ